MGYTGIMRWALLSRALALPLLCAGAVGYYLFFWGAAKSGRRISYWVSVPALVGVLAEFSGAVWLLGRRESVLESGGEQFRRILSLLPALVMDLGPGLHMALAGLILVNVAAWRVRRGLTSLPACAAFPPPEPATTAGSDDGQRDLKRFTWAVLALLTPISIVLSGGLGFLIWSGEWILWGAQSLLAGLPPALITVWVLGSRRRTVLWSMLSPRRMGVVLLAALIPILIHWIPKIIFLIAMRIHWGMFDRDLVPPPNPWDFLSPAPWQWQIVLILLGSLLSEIAWRGFALPRFIGRFGLHRGIILVGVLWGVMHSRMVEAWGSPDLGVILGLASGMLRGVALSYPLGWLTLRSKSILPAALAIGLDSAFWGMNARELVPVTGLPASHFVDTVLWLLLGFIFFRYFGFPADEGGDLDLT